MQLNKKSGAHGTVCPTQDISQDKDMIRLKELVDSLNEDRKAKFAEYLSENMNQKRGADNANR